MRHGMRKEIDWEYLGSLLANTDDKSQSAFFKAFVKECLSWGTKAQVEFQLAGINRKLSTQEKDILNMLVYEGEES